MTFATFLGALIPTAIVSRIFLLVTKRWEGGAYRIVMVHALSLITSWMIIYLDYGDSPPNCHSDCPTGKIIRPAQHPVPWQLTVGQRVAIKWTVAVFGKHIFQVAVTGFGLA